MYAFNGPHAMYMNYAADDVRADGQITRQEVLIAARDRRPPTAPRSRARRHRSASTRRSLSVLQGSARADRSAAECRPTVPVPRVESPLTFEYDVNGRFVEPFIAGRATFSPSSLLGASIGAGTVGTIDTVQTPICVLGRRRDRERRTCAASATGFGVDWMQDPRYGATIAGRFRVDGRGFDTRTMLLIVGGRITHADAFRGSLANADVSMSIHDGTLTASYSGDFSTLDPAVAARGPAAAGIAHRERHGLPDRPRSAAPRSHARRLRRRGRPDSPARRRVRGVELERGRVAADGSKQPICRVTDLDVSGPAIRGSGSGVVALDRRQASAFDYQIERADLATGWTVLPASAQPGVVATTGRLTGPWTARPHGRQRIHWPSSDAFDVTALDDHRPGTTRRSTSINSAARWPSSTGAAPR